MANNTKPQDISYFTRALWWIAGATPEILQKYPSEYAKFSAIGMTIIMTCLVAFVSGMAAAWYFSTNVIATLAFGVFWALMIFCIDRALVVTMKKSINAKSLKEKLVEAAKIIIPRAVLAVLVALLMSIPLELIVFEDVINTELPNYMSKKLEDSSKIGFEAAKKDELEKSRNELTNRSTIAEAKLDAATQALKKADKNVEELEEKIRTKEGQLDRPNTSAYNSAYSNIQRSEARLRSSDLSASERSALRSRIAQWKSTTGAEKKKWNDGLKREIEGLKQRLAKAKKEKEEREVEQKKANEISQQTIAAQVKIDNSINGLNDKITDRTDSINTIQKNTNKFILHYSVLEYAVNDKVIERVPITRKKSIKSNDSIPASVSKGEEINSNEEEDVEYKEIYRNRDALIMLWLIRILFFVFEMMPTVVKAVSKPGPYERECEAQDEQMAQFFTSSNYKLHMQNMLSNKLQHEEQLTKDRQNTEKLLHDYILSQIKDAQKEVASDVIKKWRAAQLNRQVNYLHTPSDTEAMQTASSCKSPHTSNSASRNSYQGNMNNTNPAKPYTDEFD